MRKTTPLAKTLSGILYERASRAENRPDVRPTRESILLFSFARNILIFRSLHNVSKLRYISRISREGYSLAVKL